jgi:hypothetical protein
VAFLGAAQPFIYSLTTPYTGGLRFSSQSNVYVPGRTDYHVMRHFVYYFSFSHSYVRVNSEKQGHETELATVSYIERRGTYRLFLKVRASWVYIRVRWI